MADPEKGPAGQVNQDRPPGGGMAQTVRALASHQMTSFMAIDLCQEIPYKFKDLNQYLLSPNLLKAMFRLTKIKSNFTQFSSVSFNNPPFLLPYFLCSLKRDGG